MDFHVDIGPQYEGETVRKDDMQVEFGGPKSKAKFELVTLKNADEIEDGKVEVIGPDMSDVPEKTCLPLAIMIDIAGEELEKDMEPVIERRMHLYANYIEGLYHMNQRSDIWIRFNKDAYKKGLTSLKEVGDILIFLFQSELMAIEKMQITFITDEAKVIEEAAKAKAIYDERDKRLSGLKEEDVEEFYGCVLCQSFAPTHICTITPERIANCGAINWFDGRAAYKLDPEGPIFAIPKGECIDPVRGEYAGVNDNSSQRSLGEYSQVYLHSAFEHPHTSCGCFQSICFYIPEVDAFGIVHRDFAGPTVTGESFSRMAGTTSGGRQVEGSLGMALEYLKSPKFIQADGGMYRMVWMPKDLKERYKEYIPADLYDKIATEDDAKDADALTAFLESSGHPWLKGEVELPG